MTSYKFEYLKSSFRRFTVVCLLFVIFGCANDDDTDPIKPEDKNTPPVANAGADQLVTANQSVQLDGSDSSDNDGTIESYMWKQVEGTAVAITGYDTMRPHFTAPNVSVRETLTFQLHVTDDDGATHSDRVSTTINIPPTADAGLDQEVLGGDTVQLAASASDNDEQGVRYMWEQSGGATVTLSNADTASPRFTAPTITDTLIFQVTVTDYDGHQSVDKVRIYVSEKIYADTFMSPALTEWVMINQGSDQSPDWGVADEALILKNRNKSSRSYDQSYHEGTFLYLAAAGSGNWDNYKFSVEITPLTNDTGIQGNDVGIQFRYTPANDSESSRDSYYRLTMNARYGFTRLEKRVKGQFSSLAVDARGYTENKPHLLAVEVSGALIHVYIDDEAVFSVTDTDLATGTIALYGQDTVKFDNVVVSKPGPAPSIVMCNPLGYGIATVNGQSTMNLSATVTDMPAGGSVAFVLDNTVTVESDDTGNPYTAVFTDVASGNHDVKALLRDARGVEIAADLNENVGMQGKYYITMGDSLTNGVFDDMASNNVSADGRIVATQGYQAGLSDLLTRASGVPHIIFNEGIGGDGVGDTMERLNSILDRHPKTADAVLLMIGTNDAYRVGYHQTFQNNLQSIVNTITAAGKRCWLAEIPPLYHTDGTANNKKNNNIKEYNARVRSIANRSAHDQIFLGPDFYNVFLDRFDTFYDPDGIHFNDAGYTEMARLWADVIENPR